MDKNLTYCFPRKQIGQNHSSKTWKRIKKMAIRLDWVKLEIMAQQTSGVLKFTTKYCISSALFTLSSYQSRV